MQLQEILYTQGFGTRRVCAGLIQQGLVQVYMPNEGPAPVTIAQAATELIAIQRCSFQGSLAKRSTKKSSKARTAGERCLREG